MATILFADDEPAFRRATKALLEAAGHTVIEAATVAEAATRFRRAHADVAIVDLHMPGDGLALVRSLRESTAVPVLVLSALSDEAVKVAALDAGADDYITKPFGAQELLARIRTALRHRTVVHAGDPLHAGSLVLEPATRAAHVGETAVPVTPTEFDVLRVLAERMPEYVETRALLRAVWGPAYEGESGYVRAYIRRLRARLSEAGLPDAIESLPRVGYRLRPEE